jgi:hypothetical protein
VGWYSTTILRDTPVAYYRLGDPDSTRMQDWSPNGRDGAYASSGVTFQVPSLLSKDDSTAASFDGSTGYGEAVAAFSFSDTFSLEVWFRLTALSPSLPMTILSLGAGSGQLGVGPSTGQLQALSSTVAVLVQSNVAIVAGRTYHGVFTKNGATMHLYVNGVDVTVFNANSTCMAPARIDIGRQYDGSQWFFPGVIDEVAVYNYVLSPAQVAAHYAAGAPGACARQAWLVSGSSLLALEDTAAGYYCSSLDLGFPALREVSNPRPDQHGTDDTTQYYGARGVTAALTAGPLGTKSMDAVAASFGPYMTPAPGPALHYVLDRPGWPERVLSPLRATGYAAPIAGPAERSIQLQWLAAQPFAANPVPVQNVLGFGTNWQSPPTPGDVAAWPVVRFGGPASGPQNVGMQKWPSTTYIGHLALNANVSMASAANWLDVDTYNRTVTDETGASRLDLVDWVNMVWTSTVPRSIDMGTDSTVLWAPVRNGGTGATTTRITWYDWYYL